jgi:phenylacetic acid degradation operon negative regulatory protein
VRKKRQLDDPRALGEPAKGAVVFVFGLVGPDRTGIPGPALVAILDSLGFAEPTARATILRMRRDGRLRSIRRGSVVDYELTAPTRVLSAEVLRPVMGPRPDWDGQFTALLFSVPEPERAFRDQLRRAAVLAGFGSLQPGVFITPDKRRWDRLEPTMEGAPEGSRLTRAELRMSSADARRIAVDAWPLAELEGRYREQIAYLRRLAGELEDSQRSADMASPIRTLWEAMAPIFGVAAEDPGLPAELLPRDWPMEELRDAVAAVSTLLVPRVQASLRASMPA